MLVAAQQAFTAAANRKQIGPPPTGTKQERQDYSKMKEIKRYDINEDWAHAGIVQAGEFCFLNYCVRNTDGTIEQQIDGAFDEMEERLALAGMTLENVVQMN